MLQRFDVEAERRRNRIDGLSVEAFQDRRFAGIVETAVIRCGSDIFAY